ncbi:MAG: serine protease [Alphaproteobacteria bacterium]|nr:serine protease [Alphaproteobacteria bacterium]
MGPRLVPLIGLLAGSLLAVATASVAQLSGRIFSHRWIHQFPAADITTADLQHALIWTRQYGGKADGVHGDETRRAVEGWLKSKGYKIADTLSKAQSAELVAEGLRQRDTFGWSTLVDDAVGFSVGIPKELTEPPKATRREDKLQYVSNGIVKHIVSVFAHNDACAAMDGYYVAFLGLKDQQVDHYARRDDWFEVAGESEGERFHTRAQCRREGIVAAFMSVPAARADELGFLFVAMANSLQLKPALAPLARPAPRVEPLPVAEGIAPRAPAPTPRVATPPPAAAAPPSAPDLSGKSASLQLALLDSVDLRPEDVFARASPSVFVVKTSTAQGSAVAIGAHELLTNCHVVETNTGATLLREDVRLSARVVSRNVEADRCVLRTETPLSSWVAVRKYSDVRVGERAFTIGAPLGFELTIAEGIVSSKRTLAPSRLFQTTAPISRGSSGGGLFDAQGNLIGITTFMLKDSQNLNFAIAAEEYAK